MQYTVGMALEFDRLVNLVDTLAERVSDLEKATKMAKANIESLEGRLDSLECGDEYH